MKRDDSINYISLYRIIATFMVVTVHFGQSLPLPDFLHKIVKFGSEGVLLFYLISGYVIAASLSKDFDILRFYKKRVIRIIPIYYFVVTVNLVASLFIQRYPSDITKLSWWRYYLFIHAIVPTNDYFYWNNLAALWTMSSFALFYLIAPAIHFFVKNRDNKNTNALIVVCCGMILELISAKAYLLCGGVFAESGKYLASHSPFAVLFVFFIGMYIYYDSGEWRNLVLLVIIGIIGSIYNNDRFVVSALFGLLINSTIGMKFNCGKKLTKLLQFLDEYSFSIYLGHTTVMFILSRIQEQLGFGNAMLAIFDLVGCFIFIPILHKMVEKPVSRRLKTRRALHES